MSTSTPKTRIEPGRRAVQPDDRAQQHRLAGARAADDAEHLAAIDVEVEAVVDDLGAEAVDEAAHLDDRLALAAPASARPPPPSDVHRGEEDREDRVEHDDEEDREHHRGRGQPPEALGVAADLEPVVAADERDHHARRTAP